jgi:hypothetical protein
MADRTGPAEKCGKEITEVAEPTGGCTPATTSATHAMIAENL